MSDVAYVVCLSYVSRWSGSTDAAVDTAAAVAEASDNRLHPALRELLWSCSAFIRVMRGRGLSPLDADGPTNTQAKTILPPEGTCLRCYSVRTNKHMWPIS